MKYSISLNNFIEVEEVDFAAEVAAQVKDAS